MNGGLSVAGYPSGNMVGLTTRLVDNKDGNNADDFFGVIASTRAQSIRVDVTSGSYSANLPVAMVVPAIYVSPSNGIRGVPMRGFKLMNASEAWVTVDMVDPGGVLREALGSQGLSWGLQVTLLRGVRQGRGYWQYVPGA